MNDVHIQAIGEEELLLVTPHTVQSPSWQQLQALGFIDHPDGAYHAGLLLGANYPEFDAGQTIKQSGFSNQISLILEPVAMGLGFTVLPRHAISAFNNPDCICVNPLPTSVSESLYLGVHRHKRLSNRMHTVMEEAKRCLQ
jgi:DNA-binding transcriptional LysR family regulator